jgi:hypothetical protein
MALLAAFSVRKDTKVSLPDFLDAALAGGVGKAVKPDPKDVAGFKVFFDRYHQGLSIERAAVEALK